ncbi:MAG: hypothetical protein AB7S38_43455 [Vulcanimicrobiota bacterium]
MTLSYSWESVEYSDRHPLWGGDQITVHSDGRVEILQAPPGNVQERRFEFRLEQPVPALEVGSGVFMPALLPPDSTILQLTFVTADGPQHTRWYEHATDLPGWLVEARRWLKSLIPKS